MGHVCAIRISLSYRTSLENRFSVFPFVRFSIETWMRGVSCRAEPKVDTRGLFFFFFFFFFFFLHLMLVTLFRKILSSGMRSAIGDEARYCSKRRDEKTLLVYQSVCPVLQSLRPIRPKHAANICFFPSTVH